MSAILQLTTVGKKKDKNLLATIVKKTGERLEVFKDTKHRKSARRAFRFALENGHPYQVLSNGAREIIDELLAKRKAGPVEQLEAYYR